ncbi:hypothetical protein JXJ21_02140 [candidate division KSB1 bacterium]|nr:hypothetical protein [candidate division KSB1 bacterium]
MHIFAIMSCTGIGGFPDTMVPFPDGGPNSLETLFSTTNSYTPGSVGKRNCSWHWCVRKVNYVQLPGSVSIENSGPHIHYTLLAAPQSPMAEPWTDVLDYACVSANGQSSAGNAASTITQGLYNSWGLVYDVCLGAPYFTNGYLNENFKLTDFFTYKSSSHACN